MVTTTTLVRGAVDVTPLVWSPVWLGAAVTILTNVGVDPTVLVLFVVAAAVSGLGGAEGRGGLDVTMTYFCVPPASVAVGRRGAGTRVGARGVAWRSRVGCRVLTWVTVRVVRATDAVVVGCMRALTTCA
ncbi:unnamed protein product [Ixodes hexagonus]